MSRVHAVCDHCNREAPQKRDEEDDRYLFQPDGWSWLEIACGATADACSTECLLALVHKHGEHDPHECQKEKPE